MCHTFKPYNLETGKIIEIIEIPLVIMEHSFADNYMRMDSDRAWETTRQLIDTVEACNGVITFVWHNTSFFGDLGKFYEKILTYCAEKDAWMTSGGQIAAWWKDNVQM